MALPAEFIFPEYTEDLEAAAPSGPPRMRVRTVLDVCSCPDVDAVVDGLVDTLLNAEDVLFTVVQQDVFDRIYSLAKYWGVLTGAQKARFMECCTSVMNEVVAAVGRLATSGVVVPRETSYVARNGLKAFTYMYEVLVQIAEKTNSAAAQPPAKKTKSKGTGGKVRSRRGAAVDDDDDDDAPDAAADDPDSADTAAWKWEDLRENALYALVQAVCCDFRAAWSMGMPEEDFITAFVKTAQRFMNSESAMKDRATRGVTVQILSIVAFRFASVIPSVCAAVIGAIISHEHAAPVGVELVEVWTQEGGAYRSMPAASALLRELGQMKGSDPKDTAGLRRAAAFLAEVSAKAPDVVMTNMSVLLPYLDCDSYALRSALVTAMGNIVATTCNPTALAALTSSDDEPERGSVEERIRQLSKTRDTLLSVLHARVLDMHSLTRAAVMKAFISLVQHAAIPVERFAAVARIAGQRLFDKGALVRKAAAQLLRAMLENNPFGPVIRADLFVRQRDQSAAWLAQNAAGVVDRPLDSERIDDVDPSAAASSLTSDGTAAVEVVVSPEVAQHVRLQQLCGFAADFAAAIADSIPLMGELMTSKTNADVMESIRFLSRAQAFEVPGASQALARMLVLVWATEGTVKEEVIATFDKLFLLNETLEEGTQDDAELADAEDASSAPSSTAAREPSRSAPAPRKSKRGTASRASVVAEEESAESNESDGSEYGGKKRGTLRGGSKSAAAKPKTTRAAKTGGAASREGLDCKRITHNLIALLAGASEGVRASLEEVIGEVCKRQLLPTGVVPILWEYVDASHSQTQKLRMHMAQFLALRADPSVTADAWRAIVSMMHASRPVLVRARYAMCLLAMVASVKPDEVATTEGLAKMHAVLAPSRPATLPLGAALVQEVAARVATLGPAPSLTAEIVSDLAGLASKGDLRLARHVCAVLVRLPGASLLDASQDLVRVESTQEVAEAKPAKKTGKAAAARGASKKAETNPADIAAGREEIMQHIHNAVGNILAGEWDDGTVESVHWYATAQHAVDAVFSLLTHPVQFCHAVLNRMAQRALAEIGEDIAINSTRLARLCFVVGHVAMKGLILSDALAARVKALRMKLADVNERKTASKAAAGTLEDQLGGTAMEDEKEAELLAHLSDVEWLQHQLIGSVAPIIEELAKSSVAGGASVVAEVVVVQQNALLALCKLMAVSPTYCETHLPLVFTALARSPSPGVRATVATALGDLTYRFPNLVEPYTPHLYARLRDPDFGVRNNTLMVLTHLILNGMIKIKGQIGEIAVCLTDTEARIRDLARVFFNELARRSNSPIYNILPDTLSCLSRLVDASTESSAVSGQDAAPSLLRPFDRDAFRTVVRFLLSYISKDKQSEGLTEKLLHRIEASDDAVTWRDAAFCIAQLPLNEKIVRMLAEGVRAYRRALGDEDVWASFSTLLAKAKKACNGASKSELKEVVLAWEAGMAELRGSQVEIGAADASARAAVARAKAVVDDSDITESAAAALEAAAAGVALATNESGKPSRRGAGKTTSKSKAPLHAAQDNIIAAEAPAAKPATKRASKKGIVADDESEEIEEEPVTSKTARASGKRVSASASKGAASLPAPSAATSTASRSATSKGRAGAAAQPKRRAASRVVDSDEEN